MPPPRLFGLRRTTSQGSGVLEVPVDDRSEQGSARGPPRGGTPRLSSHGSDTLHRRESPRESPRRSHGPARGVMLDEVRHHGACIPRLHMHEAALLKCLSLIA